MNTTELQALLGAGSVPIIVALVQVLIKPFFSDTRVYPLFALLFGVLFHLLIGLYLDIPVIAWFIQGIMAGLAASGAYSFGSTAREGARANKKNPEHRPS